MSVELSYRIIALPASGRRFVQCELCEWSLLVPNASIALELAEFHLQACHEGEDE